MPLIPERRGTKAIRKLGSAAHATSKGNEKSLMSRLGGVVTPRSGAGLKKGDGQVKGIARVEVKGTTNKSFSVTRGLLDKTDQAALNAAEYPVIVVQFMDKVGTIEDELAVMRLSDVEEMIRRIKTLEENASR